MIPIYQRLAQAIKVIRLNPTTHVELTKLLGCDDGTARRLTTAMHDQGLLYIEAWVHVAESGRGRYTQRWGWQPEPFQIPDADKPATRIRNKGALLRQAA